MKYGANFENESVPEWSLHNIDYNSLKHHIKVHTTKGQATAIAIPGHQDVVLKKFEDEFYAELCRQHDRVGLFVTSKANELSRRLQYLSDCIHNTLRRCAGRKISAKRQRKLAKFDLALVQCGDEIHDLARFVNAQVIAFRKILKKYKKWTGSPYLTARFRENVLSDPKSFTNRDFHPLETQFEDLLSELRAPATPADSGPATPISYTPSRPRSAHLPQQQPPAGPLVVVHEQPEGGYWNEYDHGSEAGDLEGGYAIYVHPDDDDHSRGISSLLTAIFSMPVKTAKAWWASDASRGAGGTDNPPERRPLILPATDAASGDGMSESTMTYGGCGGEAVTPALEGDGGAQLNHHRHYHQHHHTHHHHGSSSAATAGYGAGDEADYDDDDDADEDDRNHGEDGGGGSGGLDYGSEDDFPRGYEARYASLPSINDQRVARYREKVLFWGTIGADAASLVLLGIAGLLIATGRHRLRVEVDAGVTVGVVASLGCACAALGMTLARRSPMSWPNRLVVYGTFAAICVLNGVLLVLVAGNTALSAAGLLIGSNGWGEMEQLGRR